MGLFSEYAQVKEVLAKEHEIVFFAESRHYFVYFERLIADLLEHTDVNICYITVDAADPLLASTGPRFRVYRIKWMLGFLWARLRAERVVMTMPDLGHFLFKKAAGVREYIYLFHAAVSTHQQYRPGAFDHFDTIFTVGPFQEQEIRLREKQEQLPEKKLVAYGYPLLEQLTTEATATPLVLVAPSWYRGGIFDVCIEPLLQELKATGQQVLVRSHPEFEKRNPAAFRRVRQLVASGASMTIDAEPNVLKSLQRATTLITDRSGIAFEYALGCGRPVLFVDTALKQTNPDWEKLGVAPIENSLRGQLGLSIQPDQVGLIPAMLGKLQALQPTFTRQAEQLKKDFYYNSPQSFEKGWRYFTA